MAKKAKLPEIEAPADDRECDTYILSLGELHRRLVALETAMNSEIAHARERYEAQAEPLRQKLAALHGAIETYCTDHRGRLTGNGKTKFYRFGNGVVIWRSRPPKVTIRQLEKALAWIIEAGSRFRPLLRVKHEIDKEAMLRWPELATQVPGVKVGSAGENFEITPNEMKLEKAS